MRELANEESSGSIAAEYELGKEEKRKLSGSQESRKSEAVCSWFHGFQIQSRPVFLRSSFISLRLVFRCYGRADEDHIRWTDGSGPGGVARGEGLWIGDR